MHTHRFWLVHVLKPTIIFCQNEYSEKTLGELVEQIPAHVSRDGAGHAGARDTSHTTASGQVSHR